MSRLTPEQLLQLNQEGVGWAQLPAGRGPQLDEAIRAVETESNLTQRAERPDGSVLRWRVAGLEDAMRTPTLPFFLEWEQPEEHPGEDRIGKPAWHHQCFLAAGAAAGATAGVACPPPSMPPGWFTIWFARAKPIAISAAAPATPPPETG